MLGSTWNVAAEERAAQLPCDALMPGAVRLDRAISIDAPVSVVFAWLCQLRVAPYSYDLLDNTGRRSPRTRSDELTELAIGQPFVRIFGRTYVFELAAFAHDEHITLQPLAGSAMSRFAAVSNTYAVRPECGGTRLHVRVLFDGPWLMGRTLALGEPADDAQAIAGAQGACRTRRAHRSLTTTLPFALRSSSDAIASAARSSG